MLWLGQTPSCRSIIRLHHWLEDESSYRLILEKQERCWSLQELILLSDAIREDQARRLMLQAVRPSNTVMSAEFITPISGAGTCW